MALHPRFPASPYEPLLPAHRWFPADEALRENAYEKLLPPLVAKLRAEIHDWRQCGYDGASLTTKALLTHWFDTEHLLENADGTLSPFRYYFAQREAVETAIWLHEVRQARDKFDLLRFDASGSVSHGILAFEFEMGLFPAVLDEAKRKGIDVAPKIIPPEVFDKRAVDKGQVRFSDVAFVEANPRYGSMTPWRSCR